MKWTETFIAPQATRISTSGVRDIKLSASRVGRELMEGAPLQLAPDRNGDLRVPHGGVCCLAMPHTSYPFDPAQDDSHTYQKLFSTTRVHATWTQVDQGIRVRVINVYLQTGIGNGT